MRILLLQLDGHRFPNIALMRLSAHFKARGDEVIFRRAARPEQVVRRFDERGIDHVFASAIFERTQPVVDAVRAEYPDAYLGGTGIKLGEHPRNLATIEELGVTTLEQDYSLYPNFKSSIGFSQRGCRLKCGFCVVPKKEGKVRPEHSIAEIWRGDPWPRELVLLDNDFFGQDDWRAKIAEIRDGGFKVNFNQGINVRAIGDAEAEAIASVDYRDATMRMKLINTAWDNRKDEERLFRGLNLLVKYGVSPKNIMLYMLIGYWPNETHEDRDYRRRKLREFGCKVYPMPFVRTPELIQFQAWCVLGFDWKLPWEIWKSHRVEGGQILNRDQMAFEFPDG